ncbi:hypothetical protein N0V90_004771 [Kalmusia sp. IMI 367209]|nr:hypothetical protein N0V90_004771 [Kalmusia sp. IMI 367209]
MLSRLPISLLSAIAWVVMANAIPADPTITPAALLPRQADAGFVGWVQDNGTWTSQHCDSGLTWYQSGNYILLQLQHRWKLITVSTENYRNATYSICNTAFIFESFGDSNPKTDIICGASSQNWSYYRQVPASVTAATASSNPSETSGASGGKSSSKAWIAGAVVGPIVGIALIAGIIFFLMRRRKNKNNNNLSQAGAAAMAPPPGYTDAKPQLNNPAYGQSPPGVADSYNQQGYAQQPISPVAQYQQPYGAPASPPPHQSAYAAQDAKFGTAQPHHPQAAELGGLSSPTGGSHTAELSSEPYRS